MTDILHGFWSRFSAVLMSTHVTINHTIQRGPAILLYYRAWRRPRRLGRQWPSQQLLVFDVDVNAHGHQGRMPFQIVVEGGHGKVKKLLLDRSAERP